MNTIFGQFNWEEKKLKIENHSYYEDNDFVCFIYGDAWLADSCNNYPAILRVYQKLGDDIVNHIEGLYYLIIYDKSLQVFNIYQDYFTAAETLYYTISDSCLYFSNDMKQMVLMPEVNRIFNEAVTADFVKYGYVSGKDTLIENVYKIAPFCMLFCRAGQVVQQKLDYMFDVKDEETASRRWVKDLNRAIRMNTPEGEPVVLPLSGGFDSNYIFHYYNRMEKPTKLFTVGGADGIDETRMVKKIVNAYNSERNELHLSYTTEHTLQCLPDIIWRLGGLVYQRGIFLQYELAKKLSEAGAATLICGECADQVMHEHFLEGGILNENPQYKGSVNPYDFAAHIIIKKSAVMLNSFGIKGFYPYMNQRFVTTAMGLAKQNGTTKEFHRKVCNQILPNKVKKCLYKNGGATDIQALFATEEEKQEFIRVVEGTKLFQTHYHLHGKKQTKAQRVKQIINEKEKYAKIFVRKLMGTLGVQSIKTLTPKYRNMEQRLRRDMGYFYLMIFKELFCSERTDTYLKEGVESFDVYAYIEQLGEEV